MDVSSIHLSPYAADQSYLLLANGHARPARPALQGHILYHTTWKPI